MTGARNAQSYSNLKAIAKKLEGEYESRFLPEEWIDSPFEWLKVGLPSRTRGKVAEQLVEGWLSIEGFEATSVRGSDADLLVNGKRVEVKSSTLWKTGKYKFQQIRDQDYEILICLGLSPSEAHYWVLSKALAISQAPLQHGGAAGGSNIRWLTVDPKSPLSWLRPRYGGLHDSLELLREATA